MLRLCTQCIRSWKMVWSVGSRQEDQGFESQAAAAFEQGVCMLFPCVWVSCHSPKVRWTGESKLSVDGKQWPCTKHSQCRRWINSKFSVQCRLHLYWCDHIHLSLIFCVRKVWAWCRISNSWSVFQGSPGNRGFPGADGLPGPKVQYILDIFLTLF